MDGQEQRLTDMEKQTFTKTEGEIDLDNTENILKENYDLIWKKFLQLEIKRSCEAVKLAGSANLYLILQVIAWHNFLLVTDETDTHSRIDIFDKWVKKKLSKNII